MLEKSRFSIFDHVLNFFSRNKRDPWHKPVEVSPGYYAYTRQFDREVSGKDLAQVVGELSRDADDGFRTSVAGFRLALALQRELLASFLAELYPRFKAVSRERSIAVTFLIDHSGSMRGEGIQLAALLTGLLGEVLFDVGARVEALGFTTSSWQGGKSREFWLELGKHEMPGRLCDLLHVIHRASDASEPWNDDDLHTMLRPNLLKENVDGEALIWAEERLLATQATDKFLIVLSDGAPVDDSTLQVNTLSDGQYPILFDHLKSQIVRIEAGDLVSLLAIGINHRVDQYYTSSVVLNGAEDIKSAAAGIVAFVLGDNSKPKTSA